VNHALPLALALLRDTGRRVAPRGLPTIEIVGPFATTYTQPAEMVLFDGERDANPFFHLFEAMWILAGRKDVQFLAWFLPRMEDFSDDGVEFHAPYGYRMRHSFGFDQIEFCIKALSADRDTRQAVISIWHPALDWKSTKDRPCNDMVMLKVRKGALRMTVCNRSNDAILGAYGANVVQFSTLLRYVAGVVGVDIGEYTQISDSFHVYEDNPYWKSWLAKNPSGVQQPVDPYDTQDMRIADSAYCLANGGVSDFMNATELSSGEFDDDLISFFRYWDETKGPSPKVMNERNYGTSSFVDTLLPMLQTLILWRAGKRVEALEVVRYVKALDWKLAATGWIQRRIARG
jgi:hypothetical protein